MRVQFGGGVRGHAIKRLARLLGLLALGGLFVLAAYAWVGYRDPSTLAQDDLYKLATYSPSLSMTRIPKQHSVRVEPLERSQMLPAILRYLPAPVGRTASREGQGFFDPADESIRIVGEMVRLQAGLPRPFPKTLFRRALRHEYGHAFFFDWAQGREGGEELFAATIVATQKVDPSEFPSALRPLVAEYRELPPDIYGDRYFTAQLSEYLAESYARVMDGRDVPKSARDFIEREGEAKRR